MHTNGWPATTRSGARGFFFAISFDINSHLSLDWSTRPDDFSVFFVAVEIDSSVFGRPSANWRIAPSVTDFGGGSDDVPNVKGAGAFSIDPAAATLQQHGLHVFLVCCVAFSRRPSKPVDALRATLEHREKKEKWAKMGARNQEKWGPSTA